MEISSSLVQTILYFCLARIFDTVCVAQRHDALTRWCGGKLAFPQLCSQLLIVLVHVCWIVLCACLNATITAAQWSWKQTQLARECLFDSAVYASYKQRLLGELRILNGSDIKEQWDQIRPAMHLIIGFACGPKLNVHQRFWILQESLSLEEQKLIGYDHIYKVK